MSSSEHAVIHKILEQRFLPIYFESGMETSVEVLKTLYNAGVRVVEYTNRGESALRNFVGMRKIADDQLSGMYLGIGTIKDKVSAMEFISAGADFIISPGIVTDVMNLCKERDILCIPGCMTPSEIIVAEQLGATMIKLFPGNVLGPGFIKAIKSLFPGLLFMPTGGVSTEQKNIEDWFDAGASAVGLGSALIGHELSAKEDYINLTKKVKDLSEIIRTMIL